MGEIEIKKNIITNLFWKLMERSGVQIVQFIVQILLARMLLPEDYGVIAILTIFINFANTLVQSGMNMALIQKKDSDELDFSSVFYISVVLSLLLYSFLYFIAPVIADFYQISELVLLLRVLSIGLFIGAVNSIQVSLVSKKMEFKKLFFSSLGGVIISGIIGILL